MPNGLRVMGEEKDLRRFMPTLRMGEVLGLRLMGEELCQLCVFSVDLSPSSSKIAGEEKYEKKLPTSPRS